MTEFNSIDEYIASHDEVVQKYLKELRILIKEAAPHAEELINYNIPAFALEEGGKRDQQIMMAGYKKHVGFYPHPDIMEAFWDRLDGYKKAKGSVQFPINEPLPKELIIEMVRHRISQLSKT